MARSNGVSACAGGCSKLLVGDACSRVGKIGLLLCFIDVCILNASYLERGNVMRLGCLFIFNCCSFCAKHAGWAAVVMIFEVLR